MTEWKILLSSTWVMNVKILTANFSTLANSPLQNYFSRQLTPKLSTERRTTLLTKSEVHKFIEEKPRTQTLERHQ